MKIIMKISLILLIAAIIAGGYTLVVNHASTNITPNGDNGQPPAQMSTNGQPNGERPERAEGGEHGASLDHGFLEVLITLAKLACIIIVVLFIEKEASRLGRKRVTSPE